MKGPAYSPDYGLPSPTPKTRLKLPVYVNPDVEKRGRFATGKYIKRWMLKLDLDYATVAKVLGVHPITVRNWEKAKSIRPIVKFAFDRAFRDSPRHRRSTMPKWWRGSL